MSSIFEKKQKNKKKKTIKKNNKKKTNKKQNKNKTNAINVNFHDYLFYSNTFFIKILPNMSERKKKKTKDLWFA